MRVPQQPQVAAACRAIAHVHLPRQPGVLHGAQARPRRECEARARELVEFGEEHLSKDVWGKGPEEGAEPVAAVSGGKGTSLGRSGSVAEGPARGVVDGRHRRPAREGE